METALLLDTETTGLDPVADKVIEVGVSLYNLSLGCVIETYSALIRHGTNQGVKFNKIPPTALLFARRGAEVWERVAEMADRADAIAAHNASFDRSMTIPALDALVAGGDAQFGDPEMHLRAAPWCCTIDDFDWPGVGRAGNLPSLVLAYGMGVASAHRAMTDVDSMARVLTRVHELGHSLPDLFKRAARPKRRFVAVVSYEMRDMAKAAGFRWDDKRREWWRCMPPEDTAALSFRTREAPL